jgi:hypothetical protein
MCWLILSNSFSGIDKFKQTGSKKKDCAGLLRGEFKRRKYETLTGPAAVKTFRASWFKQVLPSLITRDDDLNAGTPGFFQRGTQFPVSLLR